MSIRRSANFIKRNDRCPCGSGRKFKSCCSPNAPDSRSRVHVWRHNSFDSGEQSVRWLITNATTTQFFADKDNRALVFKNQADAIAVASLDEFHEQEPGDINVAGVGETKWQHLQSKVPFVEIEDVAQAVKLVRERIEWGKAGELTPSKPLELNNATQENCASVSDGRNDCRPQEKEESQE